ncbi:MAG: trypsin-like peptidase domain-containing protein [Planctomycetes bacterium]|nr:trypsin-like peptidase domain-containing protein [Planctomycetota bacterium]
MALSYPENTVWYIEARPWQGPDKDNPGFAPVEPTSRGSGVVITLTKELPNDERKTQTYLLTCAHVVRDRKDLLLEDIICYPPGLGFVGTGEKTRQSGEFKKSTVETAFVSKYSPCKGERGPRPDKLRNDPAADWVLLEINDSSFCNQPPVNALHYDNLSEDQSLQIIGFPGGDTVWKSGDIVNSITVKDFRPRAHPSPGMIDYWGSDETRPGMSGGGVFTDDGALVGIHRSNSDAVMKRGGIRAEVIVGRLQKAHKMDFLATPRSAEIQLKNLVLSLGLDNKLLDLINSAIKKNKETESSSEADELLEQLENAAEESDRQKVLDSVRESLEQKQKDAATTQKRTTPTVRPDYVRLSKQLKRGEVILCLGQEISHLLGGGIPSTAEIKKYLGQENFLGPLSELCENKLSAPDSDRNDLIHEVRDLLDRESPSVPLYELLAGIAKPFTVISVGYDDLLQQSLRAAEKKFVEIYPVVKKEHCLLVYSDGEKEPCSAEKVSELDLLAKGYRIIYRLRGGIVRRREQLLLSEQDYLSFNKVMDKLFPDYIGDELDNSLMSLWFLGLYPESWEERMMIRFLRGLQLKDASALAVQEHIFQVDQDYWQSKGIKTFDLALADFVRDLAAYVQKQEAAS